MNNKRIVITGIGIVSPLGNDTQTTWKNLLAGKSGVDTIKKFDASTFTTKVGAEVENFSLAETTISRKIQRYAIDFTKYALAAAAEAFNDAAIRPTQTNATRWGITVGCGMIAAEFDYLSKFQQQFAADGAVDMAKFGKHGLNSISASQFSRMQSNAGIGLLAQQFNIQGYTAAVHTACASGGQGLALGLQAIRRGDCDYVLAGGFDSMLNPIGLAGFCLLGALSSHNETPQSASRPFDLTRNGFVLGEGAAFLILEEYNHAKARNAKIYAELAGEGTTNSCYRITDSHPDGDGAIQAMQAAIKDADVALENIQYVNAHGTSTKMNDISETNALKQVFGPQAKQLAISSTKGQIGHLISAAGAIEGAFTALSIQQQKIPMTAHLTTPDPECDLDYVADKPRDLTINTAMSNSFGFGGTNSVLIFKAVE
ncbi:MAG: beta-ketoacyl-[acyl-carrier-protein] synthase family protein [Pseudomonadota bacterium]